jgi:hypothetical protein
LLLLESRNRCHRHALNHQERDRTQSPAEVRLAGAAEMDQPIAKLSKLDIVRGDLDYHLIRATMVILSSSSAARNGSITRPTRWSPSSAMAP